jgi:hypothetical protein
MNNIITIGLKTEGSTDVRFLSNIIQRTFEEIAFDCVGDIEVFDIQPIAIPKGAFVQEVIAAVQEADRTGLMVLCVHTDADTNTDIDVFANKIKPAFDHIQQQSSLRICQNLVAIVPIQMTEAWMLADTAVLKHEIGTAMSDNDLGINRSPEQITDPKACINEAIRRAFVGFPKRRRNQVVIGELYAPLGQKINLAVLSQLSSYQRFRAAVYGVFEALNYMDR